MFKSNKGAVNLTILIVSIVAGVLILGTIAGIIIWIVMRDEPERRSRDRGEMVDGYRDCGVSDIFLTSNYGNLSSLDFEEDDVFVCMGRNIENNCKDSTSVVKTDDFDMTYKVSETSEYDCKVRLEVYDEEEELGYVECPLSGLILLPDISSYYKVFENKLSEGPGSYAGCLLMMIFDVADKDWDIGEEILGCTGNFD